MPQTRKIKKMDVCFVNTRQENFQKGFVSLGNSYKNQPLDLAYCAAILEKAGYKAAIIDANLERLTHGQTVEKIKAVSPKVVVVNTAALDRWECPLPTIGEPKKLINLIRQNLKEIFIAVIGPHGTVTPAWLLQKIPKIDILIRGEPEITLWETVDYFFQKRPKERILGISYRQNGKIKNNPSRPYLKNLDELPLPAYHLLPMAKYGPMENFLGENYQGPTRPFSIIVTGRGCPAQCIYCFKRMYQEDQPYRKRSAENVLAEIGLLIKKFKIKAIYFHDLNFCVDKKRVREICEGIIKKGLKFSWGSETRFDNVDLKLLVLMKKAGCEFINFGFESGSQEMLNRMKKNILLEQMRKTLKDCRKAKILVGCFKLLGLPGETIKTLRETLQFLLENDVPIPYPFPIIPPLPYPGTQLHTEGEREFKTKITWEKAPLFAGRVGTDFFAKNSFWNLRRITYEYKLKGGQERQNWFFPNKHYLRLSLLSLWEKIGRKNFLNMGSTSSFVQKKAAAR